MIEDAEKAGLYDRDATEKMQALTNAKDANEVLNAFNATVTEQYSMQESEAAERVKREEPTWAAWLTAYVETLQNSGISRDSADGNW